MNSLCTELANTEVSEEKKCCKQVIKLTQSQAITGVSLVANLTRIIERIKTRYVQYRDRQAFQQLLKLDEHMLKDIGVTRQDVTWANNLPLSEDAATKLEIIARRR